jgi:hypothetical protein
MTSRVARFQQRRFVSQSLRREGFRLMMPEFNMSQQPNEILGSNECADRDQGRDSQVMSGADRDQG